MTMPIPDGSAVTTPNQMLGQLQEVVGELRELRGALTPSLAELRADAQGARKDIDDLRGDHGRLRDDVTVLKTQLKAAWAGISLLLIALGVVAAFVANAH